MQATTSPSDVGGGYATRRGHVPQLSISDPSHHVTEAIGHMYNDDYDPQKRLSYVVSPLSESISTIPLNNAESGSPSSPPSDSQVDASKPVHPKTNGQTRPSPVRSKSYERDAKATTTSLTRTQSDTANSSFPLNDIGYESNPAAVAQELVNLAAIRRMSMDVAAAGDPDLPSFGTNFPVPSLPPSPSADEDDTSRLFWVPARLHPELAPKEFKSFLESKAEQIKRKSGDFSSLGPDRQGLGGGLRRKKSMLSKQIDNANGYTDGAERLERKRSESRNDVPAPNLQDLETLVDGSKQLNKDAASLLQGLQSLGLSSDEDKPILPPAPPGHSLRRSTRTQYTRGSLRRGAYSKRLGRASDASEKPSSSTAASDEPSRLVRVSTDPTPNGSVAHRTTHNMAGGQVATESNSDQQGASKDTNMMRKLQQPVLDRIKSTKSSSPSSQARQWHSRISSNGRSTLQIPPSEQKVPEIITTPPSSESNDLPATSSSQQKSTIDREPQHSSSPSLAAKTPTPIKSTSKQPYHPRQSTKSSTTTLNDFASSPQPLSGITTRTDSLSFIPTLTEDKKTESKKSKEKKDGEGNRKSSWHWLLGTEEKEKEKKKDKSNDSKKTKSKELDNVQDTTRLDALQSSTDGAQRGRESLVLDRLDPKLEEERRKDNIRRSSGETKKEKETSLFSSIFGGGRKKNNADNHHRKNLSRNLSPDTLLRELRPDIDYPWTRFSILEERAIYRMAHIKLANPRRALYSQVLLSNFMYSYLAKVQQMHPYAMVAPASTAQRSQKTKDQPEEYLQYQRYQEAQEQAYENSYEESQLYEFDHDNGHQSYSRSNKVGGHENGTAYGPGHYQQYGQPLFDDAAHLEDDDDADSMW